MGQQKSLPSSPSGSNGQILDPNAERLLTYAKRYRSMLTEIRRQYKRTKRVAKNLFTGKNAEIKIFDDLNELCSRCWVDHRSTDCTEKLTSFAVSMLQRMQLVDRMYIEYVYKQIGQSIKELGKQDKKVHKQINEALEPCRKHPGMSSAELERYAEDALHIWRIQQCLTTDQAHAILSSYTTFQLERVRIYDICLQKLSSALHNQNLKSNSDDFANFARDAKKDVDKEIERLMLNRMDTTSSQELTHIRASVPLDQQQQQQQFVYSAPPIERIPEQFY